MYGLCFVAVGCVTVVDRLCSGRVDEPGRNARDPPRSGPRKQLTKNILQMPLFMMGKSGGSRGRRLPPPPHAPPAGGGTGRRREKRRFYGKPVSVLVNYVRYGGGGGEEETRCCGPTIRSRCARYAVEIKYTSYHDKRNHRCIVYNIHGRLLFFLMKFPIVLDALSYGFVERYSNENRLHCCRNPWKVDRFDLNVVFVVSVNTTIITL